MKKFDRAYGTEVAIVNELSLIFGMQDNAILSIFAQHIKPGLTWI
jgi:hypothetical protein